MTLNLPVILANCILLSRTRQELGVPFFASSGFADGHVLAAALALGAEEINMGTRFISTVEAPIHYIVKEAVINTQETATALILAGGPIPPFVLQQSSRKLSQWRKLVRLATSARLLHSLAVSVDARFS